jgi:hypothetical protein
MNTFLVTRQSFFGVQQRDDPLLTRRVINCSQLILIILKDSRKLQSTFSVLSQFLVMLALWYLWQWPGFILDRSNNPNSSAISPFPRRIVLICSCSCRQNSTSQLNVRSFRISIDSTDVYWLILVIQHKLHYNKWLMINIDIGVTVPKNRQEYNTAISC